MPRPEVESDSQLGLTPATVSAGAAASVASTLESSSRPDSTLKPLTPALSPAEGERESYPDLVEYQFGATPWRCTQFNALVAEFETLTPEHLARFHEVTALHPRRWRIIRLLFGFMPVLPGADYPLAELREWGRLELCDDMGLTRPQLKAEVDAVRGAWLSAWRATAAREDARPTMASVMPKSPPQKELPLADDPILKQYGFELVLTQDERDWFIARVREFKKVLDEPMVKGLGINALRTDLRCRRLNKVLDNYDSQQVGSKAWQAQLQLAEGLAKNYNDLIQQILELFPAASNIAGKLALQPVCATITQAIQEYHAKNSTRLIDGVFTATEIQVECRRSTQMPDPRYRAGWVMYLNAAREGMFDPRWKSPFEDRFLAHVDAAWKAAYVAAADAAGEALPDLEADGPEAEYAELVQAKDE